MKREEVEEILACLGDERRVFRYYKNRYCFDLIELEMGRMGVASLKVSDLKSGGMKRYVQKPIVSRALGQCGDGVVYKKHLDLMGPVRKIPFSIRLSTWGDGDRGWDQTSRNQCNLVLQLNFDSGHETSYQKLVRPLTSYGPFEYWGHPVCQNGRKTLSWVRMDINFDTNEVLIEEIQNDWLRNAAYVLARVKRLRAGKPTAKPSDVFREINGSFDDLVFYVEEKLQPYRTIWAEAAMLAAIRFIRDDLGISTIYYHSFDTGQKLKGISGFPPKSMYTTLPEQFGFALTHDIPQMLAGHKFAKRCIKAIRNPRWYRM